MTTIYIATHKTYPFPIAPDYIPIHAGRINTDGLPGLAGDDTGDHISWLNPYYCELTVLYWLWKNGTDRHTGLVHYRRYFAHRKKYVIVAGKKVAAENDFDFSRTDIVVPCRRNYLIVSVGEHYCTAHNRRDLDTLKSVLEIYYPDYMAACKQVLQGRRLSLYNMFVGKREVIEDYCCWVFDVLQKMYDRTDVTGYDGYQKRVFGFLAERLFNIWLLKNKQNLSIEYRKVVNLEGEPRMRKAVMLLKRHFWNTDR